MNRDWDGNRHINTLNMSVQADIKTLILFRFLPTNMSRIKRTTLKLASIGTHYKKVPAACCCTAVINPLTLHREREEEKSDSIWFRFTRLHKTSSTQLPQSLHSISIHPQFNLMSYNKLKDYYEAIMTSTSK